jgi:antitoxin component YwqK of YwqJK toxin-antitoxin module
MQGLWELYFPDGVLSWRGEYKNGNKAGLRYEFLLTKIGIDED